MARGSIKAAILSLINQCGYTVLKNADYTELVGRLEEATRAAEDARAAESRSLALVAAAEAERDRLRKECNALEARIVEQSAAPRDDRPPPPGDRPSANEEPPAAGEIMVAEEYDFAIPAGLAYDDLREAFIAVAASAEFQSLKRFFSDKSPRSLLTATAQAHLYLAARVMKPVNVVEIGTYHAGTAETVARALAANGSGQIHTVAPDSADIIRANIAAWPQNLRDHVVFHEMNSAGFFEYFQRNGQQAEIFLIDGNHDFDYVLFDLFSAARRASANALIFVDNISQPGVYWAGRLFRQHHPEWTAFGINPQADGPAELFDRGRSFITDTDFLILRAPSEIVLLPSRVYAPGVRRVSYRSIAGLRLRVAPVSQRRRLHVQVILRATATLEERVGSLRVELTEGEQEIFAPLGEQLVVGPVTFGAIFAEFVMIIDDGIAEPITLSAEPAIEPGDA